jgi:type II secretion system protein G
MKGAIMKQRLVIIGLLLGMSIFSILASCTTTPSDPTEAKQKRMAEIINEIVTLKEEIEKNPQLQKDPAVIEKATKLDSEGDKILNELSGGDQTKKEGIMLDIVKKYAPQHLQMMLDAKNKAQIAKTRAQIRNIQIALEQYKLDTGNYPTTAEGLTILTVKGDKYGPYIETSMLNDPWGNPLIYKLVDSNQFILKSLGPDGKEVTDSDIEVK